MAVPRTAAPDPILEGLGTAVPGAPVAQSAMKARAQTVFEALAPEMVDRLDVFDSTGIKTRHFVRPMDWYLETHGWAERTDVYLEAGLTLAEEAARNAIAAAGVPATAIDGVVFVCTTGIATPSLDARLIPRLGLRADVTRTPVWGLGCAGGVAGLNLTADLARANPDRRYLLIALETCSLAFNPSDLSVRAFVATTLFSDGAAAAVVRGADLDGKALGTLRRGVSHTWPDSTDVMGWDVLDEGLRVVFSRRIPTILAESFGPMFRDYLKTRDARADRYVFHPGGRKVLESYAESLGEPESRFETSRATLAEFGNMSSPTVIFALERSLRAAPLAPGETAALAAVGPGFSGEFGLLEG